MASEDLTMTFEAFTEQCVWLNEIHVMRVGLYTTAEAQGIQQATAPVFFFNLWQILRDAFVLQVCKLNDPASSPVGGKQLDNLTIKHVNELLKTEGLLSSEIQGLSDRMDIFYQTLKDARNKYVSHLDKQMVLSNEWPSPYTASEVDSFLANLYEYVDLVGEAIGVGPLDFKNSPGGADVEPLLQYLENGRQFKAISNGII